MKAFLFFIVNLFVLLAWARPAIEVRAQNNVTLNGKVTLGDLADFKGFGQEMEQRWKPIVVLSNWQGQSTEISRSQLVQILKQEMSDDIKMKMLNPSLVIPEAVRIEKKKIAFDEKSIGEVTSEALAKVCSDCQIEILSVKIPRFNGDVELVELNTSELQVKASQTIPVKILIGKKVNEALVAIQSRIKREAVVANRPLRQGDRIQSSDLEFGIVDISNIADSIALESEIIGKKLSRSIASGQAVLKSDVLREPAVKRGQQVKISTGNSLFEISTMGQAEENGFIGDIIKIKASENNRALTGKVVDEGKVLLQ